MVAHRLPEGDFGHNPYDQVEQFVGSHLDPESGDFAGEKWGDHSNSMWIWIYLGFTAVHLDSRDDLTTGRHWMTVVINFASRIANFGCTIAKFRTPHLWWFRAAWAQWATIPTRLGASDLATWRWWMVFMNHRHLVFFSGFSWTNIADVWKLQDVYVTYVYDVVILAGFQVFRCFPGFPCIDIEIPMVNMTHFWPGGRIHHRWTWWPKGTMHVMEVAIEHQDT